MPLGLDLGPVTIQRIVEDEAALFDVAAFFPTLTPQMRAEHRAWLEPRHIDPITNKLMLCFQSHLVRTPHHTILIDTCVGNHKPRPNRPFWDNLTSAAYETNLAAAGVGLGDIDYVLCTHLHGDHVGWNTRLDNGRWVPTFPKAKYVFADRELAYWTQRNAADPATCPWITDSVLPIVAARREEIVTSDHTLGDLVRLIPTPGHSIDHFSVHVGRPGRDALVTGDMVHSPIQMVYPDMGMFSDYDSTIAGETRRAIFGRFADTATRICTAHFPSPSTGRIVGAGNSFRFIED